MEEQVDRLVQKAWTKYQTTPSDQRLLIAISGIPGSGKTTLATTITTRLNSLLLNPPSSSSNASATTNSSHQPPLATYIPMDGYHLPLSHLHAHPNAAYMLSRRGAPFTFSPSSLHTLIVSLRSPLTPSTPMLYAPSFSHALKDPVENDIAIPPTSRIIVLEGNYLSLRTREWKDIAELMDELWFVEVDFEIAGRRLVKRHLEAGIEKNEAEAWRRVRENDLVNGKEIVENRMQVDEVVMSREDDSWKQEARGG